MHPRTDPVVITAVLDETGDRILMGRNVRDLASESTLVHSRLPASRITEEISWQYVMLLISHSSVKHMLHRLLLCSSWLHRAS